MPLTVEQEKPPLHADETGVIRVGHTRVTLDTVVQAYQDGATPEEISQQYPSLNLAEVYAVISYYLNHPSAVEQYLRHRAELGQHLKKRNEKSFSPTGLRDRLLTRRRGKGDGSCSH